jgi:hypothetical protein
MLTRVLKWIGLGVAGAALATVVGVGVTTSGAFLWRKLHPPAPPLNTQLATIIQRAARNDHMQLTYNANLDLHGSGDSSRVLVFVPFIPTGGRVPSPLSDEIRIYDVSHGRLVQRFRFHPTEATYDNRLKRRIFWDYTISILATQDFNGDGGDEIVANFRQEYADEEISRPVLINWNPATAQYQLTPFFPPPLFLVRSRRGQFGEQSLYARVARVRDLSNTQQPFRSVGAEQIEFAQRRGGPVRDRFVTLEAMYVVDAISHAQPTLFQFGWWSISLLSDKPDNGGCLNYPPGKLARAGTRPLLLRPPGGFVSFSRLFRDADAKSSSPRGPSYC